MSRIRFLGSPKIRKWT